VAVFARQYEFFFFFYPLSVEQDFISGGSGEWEWTNKVFGILVFTKTARGLANTTEAA
jgi:hypothetical protein